MWAEVRFIREQVGSGQATRAAMAAEFGVSPVIIERIVPGKNWNEPGTRRYSLEFPGEKRE